MKEFTMSPFDLDEHDIHLRAIRILEAYNVYIRSLSNAIFDNEPWANTVLQRLFRIRVTDDALIQLGKDTFLHASYMRFNRADTTGDIPALKESALKVLYRKALSERMRVGVDSMNQQCLSFRSFEPCERKATGYGDT